LFAIYFKMDGIVVTGDGRVKEKRGSSNNTQELK
jgi:hypothetical protein